MKKKKSFLFINPCWEHIAKKGKIYNRPWPPLCLLYCATIAEKAGCNAKIIDLNAGNFSDEDILYEAKKSDSIFITSSTLDRWQCPNLEISPVEHLLFLLKKNKVFLMGVHGTVSPEFFLKKFCLSGVLLGEPEEQVSSLAKGIPVEKIQGIAFMKNKKCRVNEKKKIPSLSLLPLPDYSLIKIEDYSYSLMGKNLMLFELSRGCPFSCVYCNKRMYENVFRMKSVRQLEREIEDAVEKHNVKNAYFIDLEFTLRKSAVISICNFLIRKDYKLNWCCQTRADTIDSVLLKKMKDAGCSLIHIGVETGSEKIMKYINKRITLQRIEKGFREAKEVGIRTAAFFMFGFPGETEEDMEKTIEFAKKINPDYASFHSAAIYPGTKLFEEVGKSRIPPYPEAYTGEYSLKFIKRMEKKAFIRFYIRPSYFISTLKERSLKSLVDKIKLFLSYIA